MASAFRFSLSIYKFAKLTEKQQQKLNLYFVFEIKNIINMKIWLSDEKISNRRKNYWNIVIF
jgi:hypothetical protein